MYYVMYYIMLLSYETKWQKFKIGCVKNNVLLVIHKESQHVHMSTYQNIFPGVLNKYTSEINGGFFGLLTEQQVMWKGAIKYPSTRQYFSTFHVDNLIFDLSWICSVRFSFLLVKKKRFYHATSMKRFLKSLKHASLQDRTCRKWAEVRWKIGGKWAEHRQKIGRIHKHVDIKMADGVPCLSL